MKFESYKDSLFLSLLPTEIRTIIYAIVLAPTGHITTLPHETFDSDKPHLTLSPSVWPYPPINLDITKTCRQIRKESTGVFWTYNTLVLTTEHLCSPAFINGLFTSWKQLRRVDLRFGMTVTDIESVLWVLQPLEALSRRGSLQEVSFTICGMGTMSTFGNALIPVLSNKALTKMKDVYDLLHAASDSREGRIPHLKRSLNLKMGIELLSAKARKEWFRMYSVVLCEGALGEIHRILRGDVRMDGVLCYRDGVRLRESFKGWGEETVVGGLDDVSAL